jgi:aspartokinase
MTKEQRLERITALIRERDMYLASGEIAQAELVNDQLRQLGENATRPQERAEKRVTR